MEGRIRPIEQYIAGNVSLFSENVRKAMSVEKALLYFSEVLMIQKIEDWIDTTNDNFAKNRKSCIKFKDEFAGFYTPEFLDSSYFVVVESIPKPNFPELRQLGFGDFLDMEVQGITYKNTYYIVSKVANDLRLHFYELVHVAQWNQLGAAGFLERYMSEVQNVGYDSAPLEKMAYCLDAHYAAQGKKLDVFTLVANKI